VKDYIEDTIEDVIDNEYVDEVLDKEYIEDKIEEVVDHEYIEEKILSAPILAAEYAPLEEAECHTCAIAADLKKQKIINDDLIKHDLLEG